MIFRDVREAVPYKYCVCKAIVGFGVLDEPFFLFCYSPCFLAPKSVNNTHGGVFMKITRYVNGKKVNKALSGEIVIQNELISGTIEKVNSRFINVQTAEKRING